jgi:glycosyltransferase XagB
MIFQKLKSLSPFILLVTAGVCISIGIFTYAFLHPVLLSTIFISYFSTFMIIQGLATLYLMFYSWNDPDEVMRNKSPDKFIEPSLSFTAIIPARHEEKVIGETLKTIANINYPHNLCETLVICSADDSSTIKAAQGVIKNLSKSQKIKIILVDNQITSKPKSLNAGLKAATGDIVAVFDAEDEPHSDIYQIINTVINRDRVDIVQSGVQLVNFESRWFSLLNVMEYFFWFKSFLQFFSKIGLIPLGGNTVFFKRKLLLDVNGWDENSLTEDADIGFRLSTIGAKIRVVYDEIHATHEESPLTASAFIRQRTRWNQGFIQVFAKKQFLALPKLSQQIIAAYILLWPLMQAFLLLYFPVAIFVMLSQKIPVPLAMLSNLPTYILLIQMATLVLGIWEFTHSFNKPFRWYLPFKLILTFIPYQILLGISAYRAFWHILTHKSGWEKTKHYNVHRSFPIPIRGLAWGK